MKPPVCISIRFAVWVSERVISLRSTPYVLISLLILTGSADAYQDEHLRKLKETGICVHCDLRGADLSATTIDRSGFGSGLGADLRETDLSGANLQRAQLDNANLSEASLISVAVAANGQVDYNALIGDPRKAVLVGLKVKGNIDMVQQSRDLLDQLRKRYGNDLPKVDLGNDVRGFIAIATKAAITDLTGAKLRGANLSEAILIGADLRGADLSGANLSKAILISANLQTTNLTRTNMSDAHLAFADLTDAVFEPPRDKLPDRFSIRQALNLHRMTFANNPDGLVELRNLFRDSGRRDLERQITFAMNKGQRQKARTGEGLFKYVFFELACDYGMSPGRPLWILVGMIVVFSAPYFLAVSAAEEKDRSIWRVWRDDQFHNTVGGNEPRRVYAKGYHAFLWAIYFSLLSAFHIGWRDLNVGAWLARIHPEEFTLHPTGWVKVVAGIQSLISVYLIALWVLTYFGRPFE